MMKDLQSVIAFLEQTNDPRVAYFSYTSDEAGEAGAISANKEGLRLYALELLKRSLDMEENAPQGSLLFHPCEWLVSETGYNLISCVRPQYHSRDTLLSVMMPAQYAARNMRYEL